MVCRLFCEWYYHWIVHDKDPTTFEEVVNIVLRYHRTFKKDHNKPEFTKTLNVKFIGKRKQSSDTLDCDLKKLNLFCAYCKKRGHTKYTCHRLERKWMNTPSQEKSTSHTCESFDVIEVHTNHLSSYECTFPYIYLDQMIYSALSGISMEHKHISCLIPVVLTIFLMVTWCSKCNST